MTTEQELAGQQNAKLQGGLDLSRKKRIAVFIISAIVGLAFAVVGFWMFALYAFIVAAIFLSLYFEANGHLHEVRRRSNKSLVPDFSKFGSSSDKSEPSTTVGRRITKG